MINIISTICHLTPNEALNEPQPGDFVELICLLETLIEHSSSVSSEECGPLAINHQRKSGFARSLFSAATWVWVQLFCPPPWHFPFWLLSWKLHECAVSFLFQIINKAAMKASTWLSSPSFPLGASPAGSLLSQTLSLRYRLDGHVLFSHLYCSEMKTQQPSVFWILRRC